MDKNPIISKLDKTLPGAVLEVRRFGRSNLQSIWIEAQSIQKVAQALKELPETKMDWLENLSVVEFEDVLVVTYFIRSSNYSKQSFALRISAVPTSPTAFVEFPSITSVWPMGELMEQEATEMFGIKFKQEEELFPLSKKLPENWAGFPMRRKYEFPKEFGGIQHVRPNPRLNQKKQDE